MDIDYNVCEDSSWIEFRTSKTISSKTRGYKSSLEAQLSPLGSKIFGFPWVLELSIEPQKVLIKREDWVDFDIIADPLKDLFEEHFKSAVPLEDGSFEENLEPQKVEESTASSEATQNQDISQEGQTIITFLDENVNPQVAAHGGRISYQDFDREAGELKIKMEGGCQGCGMAKITLREGVETALKENFSFIKTVTDVTDHDEGLNPYIAK